MAKILIMKQSDLRIGNIVTIDNVVYDIVNPSDLAYIRFINGIPLTERWLIDFGATVKDGTALFSRFKLIWKSEYEYWYVVDAENFTYLTKIEFVHEWQNFVFVMDGEELINKGIVTKRM